MPESLPLRAPRSATELFTAFTRLALQGFGGVLPVAQRELVERLGWLSSEQFLAMLSVAQVLPGPNIVNLALMIGNRFFGWRGAAAATTGILLAPLVVVLALALLARQLQSVPAVTGALRGMGVVAAGLVLSTAIKLSAGLRGNALGGLVCVALVAATALAIGWLRWPLVWVVLGLGLASTALAWRKT
ncbi:MAG: chromate transporter [Rubrivivax sp.]|nr:chromate transporter [Rubrivivax sp.]